MQCMSQMNLQLLKDQAHYSNVFIRCYESFYDFIQKGNIQSFLEQLDCFAAMVKKWNKEYPGTMAQIKKGYNKDEIKNEIKSCLNNLKVGNNKEIKYYLQKYLNLIDQKNESFIGTEKIYKNTEKKELTAEEINQIGYNIQKGNYEV